MVTDLTIIHANTVLNEQGMQRQDMVPKIAQLPQHSPLEISQHQGLILNLPLLVQKRCSA